MISLRIASRAEDGREASLRWLTAWLPSGMVLSLGNAAFNMGPPSFDPARWNDKGVVQECNNCYNYACDIRTDSAAQPGGISPMVSENCCDHISPLARADGLRDFLGDQCHPYEHLVALMANNNDDYHWFRLDRDGKWSHKYGNKPAIKLLEGGKPIDPEVYASMKLYHFCGYFCVYKPSVRIKGPGCVYAGRSLKQDSVDVSTSSAEPGPIQVTLDLYSGRPNPTWSLSPPQVEELRRLIEQSNAERCDTATQPPYLGYAGFVISNPEGVTGLPYELRVYGGMLRATEQLGERALVEAGGEQWHGAQAHALEAWLMEQAKQLGHAEAIERMGGPRT